MAKWRAPESHAGDVLQQRPAGDLLEEEAKLHVVDGLREAER
jgi:hypothetical protein